MDHSSGLASPIGLNVVHRGVLVEIAVSGNAGGVELPQRIQDLFATRPGGLVTSREMVALGHDRREVASWVVAGLTERVAHGLYRRAGAPVPATQCLHIPLRYLPLRQPADHRDPVISGPAGLALHGAEGFGLPIENPLALIDHRCRVRARNHPFAVRRTDLGQFECEHVRRIAVAPPWRCLADAATEEGISDKRLRVASDSLRFTRQLDVVAAAALWMRMDHPGARRLSAMVAAGDFEQESEGERLAFRLLFGFDGPLPDCQVVIVGAIRVDFVFLHAGLVIEYLGRPHDGQADTDATRYAAVEDLGNRVILLSRSMLRDPAPHRVRIETIRRDRLSRIRAGTLPLPRLTAQPPRLHPLRTILAAPLPDQRAA